jgi:hypothetical protein
MPTTNDYHLFQLKNHENGTTPLQFIHKMPVTAGGVDLMTVKDGTTNEEVIEALIMRIRDQNAKFECEENHEALTHLRVALMWLNERTRLRKMRGVEGLNKK